MKYGLTAGHVRRASTTLLKGLKVGEVFDGQKKFDVVVWGVPGTRADPAAIRALPIDAQVGTQSGQVRLGDVADVLVVPAPNEIRRENASRRLDVTCNVKDRDLGSVAREVEEKVRHSRSIASTTPNSWGSTRRGGKQPAGSTRWRALRSPASCCCYSLTSERGGRPCSSPSLSRSRSSAGCSRSSLLVGWCRSGRSSVL